MSFRNRILIALKEVYPKGYGVRALKRKISEKGVRVELPNLLSEFLVEYKNPQAKRGQTKMVVLTDSGLKYCDMMNINAKVEKFYRMFEVKSFKEKLDLYAEILENIFDFCLEIDPKTANRFVDLTMATLNRVVEKKLKYYEMVKRAYTKTSEK